MNTIPELIEDIRNGKMVVLVDDEDRENEGDLVMAADAVTPAAINFMTTEARGLVCLALTQDQVLRLGIPLMVGSDSNKSPNMTAFTVSIEASTGVSTGISVSDRARTIQVASNPESSKESIISPGHIFPIQAQVGGVLKRAGHTEGSIDLAVLSGRSPSATICEIMNSDGTMARVPELIKFANKHNLKIGTIEDLIEYRVENEIFVEQTQSSPLKTKWGEGFEVIGFKNRLNGREHLAIVKGDLKSDQPVLVRMHGESLLGDVFESSEIGSGELLSKALKKIDKEGRGVVVYLRQEELQGGIAAQISRLRSCGFEAGVEDSVTGEKMRDKRDYGVGAQILRALGVKKVRLLSNSSSKRVGLKGYGIEIVDREPLSVSPILFKKSIDPASENSEKASIPGRENDLS